MSAGPLQRAAVPSRRTLAPTCAAVRTSCLQWEHCAWPPGPVPARGVCRRGRSGRRPPDAPRRSGGGREGECRQGACVGGVDEAVVPQTRRGVVGMALVLILAPDRGFEGFFLLHAPLA